MFREYAGVLCRHVEGFEESVALRLLYRLFGYDHVEIPLSFLGGNPAESSSSLLPNGRIGFRL